MNKTNIKKSLKTKKIELANTLVADFANLHQSWLSKVKSIHIDSAAGDELPSYRVFNLELVDGISENKCIGIGLDVKDAKQEKQIITDWICELFYEIKEDVDRDFLHYKRDKSDYKISGENFSQELSNFILANIW